MSEKLLSCPFCGSKGILVPHKRDWGRTIAGHVECGYESEVHGIKFPCVKFPVGEEALYFNNGIDGEWELQAIKAWNTRKASK
jgi:hypothetical protein